MILKEELQINAENENFKIPLGATAANTMWNVVENISFQDHHREKRLELVFAHDIDAIECMSSDDVEELCNSAGVCCVVAFTMSTVSGRISKHLLILFPLALTVQQCKNACQYAMIPFESRVGKFMQEHGNLTHVVGMSKRFEMVSSASSKELVTLFPLENVKFVNTKPDKALSAEMKWDSVLNHNVNSTKDIRQSLKNTVESAANVKNAVSSVVPIVNKRNEEPTPNVLTMSAKSRLTELSSNKPTNSDNQKVKQQVRQPVAKLDTARNLADRLGVSSTKLSSHDNDHSPIVSNSGRKKTTTNSSASAHDVTSSSKREYERPKIKSEFGSSKSKKRSRYDDEDDEDDEDLRSDCTDEY